MVTVHSKAEMASHLNNNQDINPVELARHHGWHVVDLTCQCGNVVKAHLVDARSTIESDVAVKSCPKCGARGQWKHSPMAWEKKSKVVAAAKSIFKKLTNAK